MRIAKIETAEVDIPLVTPFKTALRTVNSVNDIVVRVTADDGRTGFGVRNFCHLMTEVFLCPSIYFSVSLPYSALPYPSLYEAGPKQR